MGMNNSLIEWTTKTWNPITGCPGPKISLGCDNCYAERTAKTRLAGRYGYDAVDPFGIHVHDDRLLAPLKAKKPTRIFVCSMGDLFHPAVSWQHIARVFAVMGMCSQHNFFVLTKRADRLEKFINHQFSDFPGLLKMAYQEMGDRLGLRLYLEDLHLSWPLPNVYHGMTICNQQEADEKLIPFKYLPDAKYFLSLEPLLGEVKLEPRHGVGGCMGSATKLVIVGGETGKNARPMHPGWVREVRDTCKEWSVPFFFKGWGEWIKVEYSDFPDWQYRDRGRGIFTNLDLERGEFWNASYAYRPDSQGGMKKVYGTDLMQRVGKKRSGRLLDGREYNEVPK